MAPKAKTGIGLLVLILAALGLETWTLSNSSPGDTISEVAQWVIFQYPFVAVLLGILIGHFVWPLGKPKVSFPEENQSDAKRDA